MKFKFLKSGFRMIHCARAYRALLCRSLSYARAVPFVGGWHGQDHL